MDKHLVRYSNKLHTVSLAGMTTKERSLFFSFCYLLKEKNTQELCFSFSDLRKLSQYSSTSVPGFVNILRSTYKKLINLTYFEETGDKIVEFVLFTKYEIDKNKKIITLRLNEEFNFILNQLNNNYTEHELLEYSSLKSDYSQLTYAFLKKWEGSKKIEIAIDDFRAMLGIPTSYDTANFNRLVLKPILKELPQYFMGFEIEKIKTARKVTHLKFIWKAKKERIKEEIEEAEIVNISEKLNSIVEKTRKNRFLSGILTDENIIKLLEMFDEEMLIKGLNYAYKEISHEIKSINYLKKTIESANLVKSKKLVVEKENNDEVKELENKGKEKKEMQKTLELDNIAEMDSKSNKPEEFNNLDKKNQKSVENEALEICAKEQQIDKKFLEMMKEKSEMIYWNTLKPYIERVMKKDS